MINKLSTCALFTILSVLVISPRAYATKTQKMTLINTDRSRPVPPPLSPATPCLKSRGMWLWSTSDMLDDVEAQDRLISTSKASGVTDIFEYLVAKDYVGHENALRSFNAKLKNAGIHAWGLEGDRKYFNDAGGPAPLYAAADALVAFNSRVDFDERFVGFQTDMEPQDGQKGVNLPPSFHNGIADSALNRVAGGVKHITQAQDREMLMRDWLNIETIMAKKMHTAGLRLGAAMPSWTSNYYGAEVKVTYNGVRQGVMKFMMDLVDDYIVMSYNTDPEDAASRVLAQVTYADTLALSRRPRVYGALETNLGVGSEISYGDTEGKNSKTAVFADIKIIESILDSQPSFCGINIHDTDGWEQLSL